MSQYIPTVPRSLVKFAAGDRETERFFREIARKVDGDVTLLETRNERPYISQQIDNRLAAIEQNQRAALIRLGEIEKRISSLEQRLAVVGLSEIKKDIEELKLRLSR